MKITTRFILGILLACFGIFENPVQAQPRAEYQGQLSSWWAYNHGMPMNVSLGMRYIPQYNFTFPLKKERLFDIETSVNMMASTGFHPGPDSTSVNFTAAPYRMWARYSTPQFELRVGLQKISFGSASSLRPLMWFDQIDPRDPLRITNGVWGALGRYYFVNNANVWFWLLWGNENTKGWEALPTSRNIPEAGGRLQYPVKRGEVALSYHFRTADLGISADPASAFSRIPENRVGIDAKWDLEVGFWVEASWIHKYQNIGPLTNQAIFNAGIDYTFGIGNGLSVIFEQLLLSYDNKAFAFESPLPLSAATVSYPFGMFDNLSGVMFYDWTNKQLTSFLNWKHDFDKVSLFLFAYWNTSLGDAGAITGNFNNTGMQFNGRGLQMMILFNH